MEIIKVEKQDSGIYEINISKDSAVYKSIMETVKSKIIDMGINLPEDEVFYLSMSCNQEKFTILAR